MPRSAHTAIAAWTSKSRLRDLVNGIKATPANKY
jgi:hypothetical protein